VSIRVVLADDNVLVREGVRALLNASDGIEVVGVASDAPTLLAAAAEHLPDVVVTDIKMPPNFRLEGIDCALEIRSRHPDTGVVVLSAHDDEEYALALLGGGESGLGYLLKDRMAEGDELSRAIHEVAAGGSMVDPTIAARLSETRQGGDEDREILDLMAEGLGYAQMAERLDTTQEAIDRRVTAVFVRLAGGPEAGSTRAVDELKRMHAVVVERSSTAEALRSYVPQQVANRLAGGVIAQQEVEVTILFSDIRGFSTIAERLGAREIADVVGRHLSAMVDVIADHGGTIDKFQGDAVMVVFGAPDPLPDHASIAVRCAIAMQARQGELNTEGWGVDSVASLGVGIGLNTGTVIAGAIGGGGRLEYTVIGDAVNVAQRLQSEAEAGQIVVAASTAAAAPGIPYEPMGSRVVKGREEPVEVLRVLL
jgi:class 3 adenylate cyclase/ActR/RegA family two-component response regulator